MPGNNTYYLESTIGLIEESSMLVEHVVMEGDEHTTELIIEVDVEEVDEHVEARREQAFLGTFYEWLEVYPGDDG